MFFCSDAKILLHIQDMIPKAWNYGVCLGCPFYGRQNVIQLFVPIAATRNCDDARMGRGLSCQTSEIGSVYSNNSSIFLLGSRKKVRVASFE